MAEKEKTTRKSDGETIKVETLFADIRALILSARRAVARSVDTVQVLTSFEIGRRIVEHEQRGGDQSSVWRNGCGRTGRAPLR